MLLGGNETISIAKNVEKKFGVVIQKVGVAEPKMRRKVVVREGNNFTN